MYSNNPTSAVAIALNRSVAATYNAAFKLGLEKTPEFIAAHCRLQKGDTLGREHQFKKGQTPFNKGLRRPNGWAPGRMSDTQFKKGNRTGQAAKNWKPIGTIAVDNEGYFRVKVRDAIHGKEETGFGNTDVWPLLNRHTWEQHKGPIPPGHIVIFKDGDRSNCAIENLDILSKADNARRNSMWARLPRELAEVIQLSGALKRKLRRFDGKKQNQRSA